MYIHLLANVSRKDISLVGGKAAALGEMIQVGLPIPDGFVITTNAFKDFRNTNFSDEFNDELENAFKSLNSQRVAVRSSAVAKDSKSISMAGQLESYLNVKR